MPIRSPDPSKEGALLSANDALPSRFPADRPLRWRLPLAAALGGAAAWGASHVLARVPGVAEAVYAQGLGPLLSRPLSRFTGALPFAVAEVALAAYLLWIAALGALAMGAVIQRRRGPLNALAGGARRGLRDGGAIVLALYLFWGFNYARPPLDARLGWPAWESPDVEELRTLAEAAVAAANQAYLELHGSPDAGVPTALPDDRRALEAALEAGWAQAAEALGLQPSVAARYGRVKRPLASPLMARLGMYGVYVPWTAEANVPRGLPAMRMPVSIAHEQAHQRGVAVEAEASFLGFVVCALSPHPLPRYAAAMFAQGQLLAALPGAERRRVAAQRLPGLERDLRDLEAFRRRSDNIAGAVQTAVNDRYLRANRVPGGVRNYGQSVQLIIRYARQQGGRAIPGRESAGEEPGL